MPQVKFQIKVDKHSGGDGRKKRKNGGMSDGTHTTFCFDLEEIKLGLFLQKDPRCRGIYKPIQQHSSDMHFYPHFLIYQTQMTSQIMYCKL